LGIELGDTFRIIHGDAMATVKRFSEEKKRFDLVFFDPPYGQKLAKKTLKLVTTRDILHPQSLVIIQCETSESLEIPEGFKALTQRRYGSSHLMILQRVII